MCSAATSETGDRMVRRTLLEAAEAADAARRYDPEVRMESVVRCLVSPVLFEITED